jgi:hypothetical protein
VNKRSERDLHKLITGQTWDQTFRTQSAQQTIDALYESLHFDSEPRLIGWDSDNAEYNVFESELDSHLHILGATQEGKSRFLQLLIRQDIERGIGACLLDPSHKGDTASQMLAYCASIGFEKVCYINHEDFTDFNRIPSIQPIRHRLSSDIAIGNLKDAFHVLWGTNDQEVPRIEKYVPAIIEALWASGLTLAEIPIFLDRERWNEREKVFKLARKMSSTNRAHLLRAFANGSTFENHFQPTINRLNPLADRTLRRMFGSLKGAIPWQDMIRKGWLVLVNLDPQKTWGTNPKPQRLLATIVISEIIHAMFHAIDKGWKGRYRLYIDEAGEYVTPKISMVLDYKSKSGLSLALAHQRLGQINDPNIRSAIETNAKAKFSFNTPRRDDRDGMLRNMGFGGDLSDRHVSYEMSKMPTKVMWVRIQKRPPRRIEIVEVEEAKVSSKALDAFKRKIYDYPWFHQTEAINQELFARFTPSQSHLSTRGPAAHSGSVEFAREPGSARKNQKRSHARNRGAVPDNPPSGEAVLLSTKGRPAGQGSTVPPKKNS